MSGDTKNAFQAALEVGSKKPEKSEPSAEQIDKPTPSPEAKRKSLSGRTLGSRAKTKPFNHRVDIATIDGLYEIAQAQGWTMNHTLSEALKHLQVALNPKD